MEQNQWPKLAYDEWKDTCNTLHRWIQIVGKVRTTLSPWTNHSWHTTLYVTSRGLTTSLIPLAGRGFSIDFDFIHHQLIFQTTEGVELHLPLRSTSVANFYEMFCSMAFDLGIPLSFVPKPNEVSDSIAFHDDTIHCSYDADAAHRFWKALVSVDSVLKKFRSHFTGKCSPVHFFWGSLDLAVTRFSGRKAPEHPGGFPSLPDPVAKEAYSHEVSSCGFWPGNTMIPYPAFYSYAYPQPPGFEKAELGVPGAYYHSILREYILPYDEVRKSSEPESLLLSFLQKTYEAAADLGHWDRYLLEDSPYLKALQEKQKKKLVLLNARRPAMAIHMKKNDPLKAKEYFQNKMTFTTGPVEVDYFMKRGDQFNLIDVRAEDDYQKGHVPNSINLPEDRWNSFEGLSKDKLNVLYCYSHVCHLAAKAAVKFASAGFPVMEMDGGFEGWQEHELPIEQGKGAQASTATPDQVAS